MRAPAVSPALALAAIAAFTIPATAQMPDLPQARPLERSLPARPVEVTVSYSLAIPVKSTEVADQRDALEQGRLALYDMAGKECKNITATIATSCKLARMNVQSNMQRGPQGGTSISGSASYHIELKPELAGGR